MLTRKQREQAQRRFVERLDGIEVTAGLTLYAVMADAKTKAAQRVTKIVAEAQKADDPATAVMTRLPEIRRVVAEEMGKESVVAGAAAAISASRREALLVGAQEGTRRVSEATNGPAVAVSADRLSERQRASDQDSEAEAARWTQGTIEAAQRGTVVQAIIVVGSAVDIKQIADVLEKAVTQRAAFGARNEVTGAARDGIMDAFRENGQAGWVWIAEDDACEFCWGMSGLVFDITEDLDSHPNCRCSQEPVEDINDPNVGFDPTNIFNELTAEEQTAVLGRQGYEDYRAGDLTLREAAAQRGARISHAQTQRDAVRESSVYQAFTSQVGDGGASRLDAEIASLVDERVTRAEELSKTLDSEMQRVADELGASLDGLAFSVKGRDSMERKVRTKVIKSQQAGSPRSPAEVIANDIRDANRYTMIVNTATYGDDVSRFVGELQARGYKFSDNQWRNTWSKLDEEGTPRAYRGLNVNMESANGDLIEIQFHTKESFATKQKNHGLYEEQRLPETTPERSAFLSGQMAANMNAIPDPVGWDKVLTVPGGSFAAGTRKPINIVDLFDGARGVKKDAADGITEVLDGLGEFMQLPASRNSGGVIPVWWGGQRFTKKELRGTVAFYQRTRVRATQEFIKSEIGMSGFAVSKNMTRREVVEDMATTFAHEFGHMVEGELFGEVRAITNTIDNVGDELYDWYAAVSQSKMAQHWRENGLRTLREAGMTDEMAADYYEYFMSTEELWARSFAQWFARKSKGKVYTEEALRNGGSFVALVDMGIDPHWVGSDFDKIEEAFDKLFKQRGWMM